jgi:hypothetical protein
MKVAGILQVSAPQDWGQQKAPDPGSQVLFFWSVKVLRVRLTSPARYTDATWNYSTYQGLNSMSLWNTLRDLSSVPGAASRTKTTLLDYIVSGLSADPSPVVHTPMLVTECISASLSPHTNHTGKNMSGSSPSVFEELCIDFSMDHGISPAQGDNKHIFGAGRLGFMKLKFWCLVC